MSVDGMVGEADMLSATASISGVSTIPITRNNLASFTHLISQVSISVAFKTLKVALENLDR